MVHHPLRREDDELDVRELPDMEMLVYDRQQRVTHFLPSETAFVWKWCDGTHSYSDLERVVSDELKIAEPRVTVQSAIDRLDHFNLLLR